MSLFDFILKHGSNAGEVISTERSLAATLTDDQIKEACTTYKAYIRAILQVSEKP